MLRYKTETRPGLVALYDIRPGNGAGQFLQPRSPHGATISQRTPRKVFVANKILEVGYRYTCARMPMKINNATAL